MVVATGVRLSAAAGLALALASVSASALAREEPDGSCFDGYLSDCPQAAFSSPSHPPVSREPARGRTGFKQTGKASWYGPGFHGRKTASGTPFDQHAMTAAHRTLPLGTEVKVTNLQTGRTILVQINDRGPYIDGRIIDLSKRAAAELGMEEAGVVPVKVETQERDAPIASWSQPRDPEVAEQP